MIDNFLLNTVLSDYPLHHNIFVKNEDYVYSTCILSKYKAPTVKLHINFTKEIRNFLWKDSKWMNGDVSLYCTNIYNQSKRGFDSNIVKL